MVKTLVIFSLFFHAAITIQAQQITQTIRGQITDAGSKAPIPFATIILEGTDPAIGTTSDGEGKFEIKNVPVGRYDIKVSFIGYEPAILKEVLVGSSKATFITVSLTEKVTALNEVVVKPSISKEEPLNTMATVSARMLSVEEANRYAGGFDDPARLASSFAGVASNVANNGIAVRGNAPRSLQWKMEGVEIPNPNHFAELNSFGGGGLTALSSRMLANSDFFTGAFPAEYNNALSGVFDIKMRNGNNQKREHAVQLGIIGIDVASEGPFKNGGNSSYLFNYRYSTLSLIMPLLPPEAQGTKYQDLSFKFNFPTKNAGTFSLWGLGLIDGSGQTAKKDSTQWLYMQDREEGNPKQYMGAGGLSHKYFFDNTLSINTTLAANGSGLNWIMQRLSEDKLFPHREIQNNQQNLVLTSSLNKKFSASHTNKSGFTITGLMYDMLFRNTAFSGGPLITVVDERGFSSLISAYTGSSYRLNDKWTVNGGLNGQLFTLNNRQTIEPRIGIKNTLDSKQSLAFAYGKHSRLEKLNYYFASSSSSSNNYTNRNLNFSKAHHFVFSYNLRLTENFIIKAEPYYQYLFDIPVIAGTSFSFINLQNEWFINQKLENTGKGRNYGVDFTLERYLSKGYYFMVTASAFNSEYLGGDDEWRSTAFNRKFLINALAGAEWKSGKKKQNLFGVNGRVSMQGGDPYTPYNEELSKSMQEVVYDLNRAYAMQTNPSMIIHFTVSYKINKSKTAQEIALKVINAGMHSDFFGYRYNFKTGNIDEHREVIFIPNLSYKVEF
jgi:hypothetical protein